MAKKQTDSKKKKKKSPKQVWETETQTDLSQDSSPIPCFIGIDVLNATQFSVLNFVHIQ